MPRMEGLAFKFCDGDADSFFCSLIGGRIGALFSVERIAEKRAANMGEMDADLMRPACLEWACQCWNAARGHSL